MMALADLLSILQATSSGQGAPIVPDPMANYDPTKEPDIVVTNTNRQPSQVDVDLPPPSMGNADYLEEARAALGNAPQHKGMFGVRGTLRNILGALGDAFLVQSGNKPMYRPIQERERASDALGGFTANPLAAVERLSQVDPAAAQELYNSVASNQVRQEMLARQLSNDSNERYQKYSRIFSQVAGASNPETYKRMIPLLKRLKQQGGLGDEFVVPDEYDENLMKTYQFGGMPAQQQVADVRKVEAEQGRNTRAEHADEERMKRLLIEEAGRNRRDNPPASQKRSIGDVDAEVADAILKGTATPRQQQYYQERLARSSRRGGRTAPALPPAPRRVGDRIRGPDGSVLISKDGRTWARQ